MNTNVNNEEKLTFVIPKKTSKKGTVFGISKEGFFILLYLLSCVSGLIFALSLVMSGIFFLLVVGIILLICYVLSMCDDKTGIENIKYYIYIIKVRKADHKNVLVSTFEKELNYITKLKLESEEK